MKHRWLWGSRLFITALLGYCYMIRPKPGPVVETWVSTGQTFKVRITAFQEKIFLPGLPGRWFKFEAQPPQSTTWQEITWIRHDDPISIPSENVRFVNSQISFMFMGWMYAVTTDAGKTWTVWNAEKNWPDCQTCGHTWIKDVSLTTDGKGEMTTGLIGPNHSQAPQFHTSDYGKTWQKEP